MLRCHACLTSLVINLATCGPTNPGIVATVLDMPINIPAYFGAISRRLMLKPATEKPDSPTDKDRKVIARSVAFP